MTCLKAILLLTLLALTLGGCANGGRNAGTSRKPESKIERELKNWPSLSKPGPPPATSSTATVEAPIDAAKEERVEQGVYTPKRGSAERKAILDAVRVKANWKHLFIVRHLHVKDGWAYAELDGYKPEDPDWRTELLYALATRSKGEWTGVFAADATYAVGSKLNMREWLRRKYQTAPPEVFDPHEKQ